MRARSSLSISWKAHELPELGGRRDIVLVFSLFFFVFLSGFLDLWDGGETSSTRERERERARVREEP